MDIVMDTSPEDSVINFDLDLLLGPASASVSKFLGYDNGFNLSNIPKSFKKFM